MNSCSWISFHMPGKYCGEQCWPMNIVSRKYFKNMSQIYWLKFSLHKKMLFYHHVPILYFVVKLVVNLGISMLRELECSFLWELLNHFLAIVDLKAVTQHEKIFEIPQGASFYDYKLLSIKKQHCTNIDNGNQKQVFLSLVWDPRTERKGPDNQRKSVFNSKPLMASVCQGQFHKLPIPPNFKRFAIKYRFT